jgi:hypothetical protein
MLNNSSFLETDLVNRRIMSVCLLSDFTNRDPGYISQFRITIIYVKGSASVSLRSKIVQSRQLSR